MRKFPFLPSGKENPKTMVEGQRRERAKYERRDNSWDRYYEMLKKRKKELEKFKPPEEKARKKKKVKMPVWNAADNPRLLRRD